MVRDKILILENEEDSRAKLVEIFKGRYKILEAATEKEGVDILKKNMASIAVILVNLMIPARNNFQVLERLYAKKICNQIPFIMLTSDKTLEFEKKVTKTEL